MFSLLADLVLKTEPLVTRRVEELRFRLWAPHVPGARGWGPPARPAGTIVEGWLGRNRSLHDPVAFDSSVPEPALSSVSAVPVSSLLQQREKKPTRKDVKGQKESRV